MHAIIVLTGRGIGMLLSIYRSTVPASIRARIPQGLRRRLLRFVGGEARMGGRPVRRYDYAASIGRLTDKANRAREGGRWTKVIENLTRAIDLAERYDKTCLQPNMYMRLADAYSKLGDLSAARRILCKGCKQFPRSQRLIVKSARCAMRAKDLRTAAELWARALKGGVRARLTESDFAQAVKAFRHNELTDKADMLLSQGLSLYPESFVLWRERAELSMATNDWEAAISSWSRAASLEPAHLTLRDRLSWIRSCRMVDRYAEAERLLTEVLALRSQQSRALFERAQLSFRRTRFRWWMNYAYQLESWDGAHCDQRDWNLPILHCKQSLAEQDLGPKAREKVTEHLVEAMAHKAYAIRELGGSHDFGLQALLEALDVIGIREGAVRRVVESVLLPVMARRDSAENDIAQAQAELIAAVAETDSSSYSSWQWLRLERILMWWGLLRASVCARSKGASVAIQQALEERDGSVNALVKGVLGALEADCTDAADIILQVLDSRPDVPGLQVAALRAYRDLVAGNPATMQQELGRAFRRDQALVDLLQGKKIAIVGPAPSEEAAGTEIDSFDVVVRLNRVTHEGLDSVVFGTRTDLASFNIERLKAIVQQQGVPWNPEVRCILVKNPPTKRELSTIAPYHWVVRDRRLENYQLDGTINHVPTLIFFLLRYSPAVIKLFNVNFFLSENPYDESYRGGVSLRQLIWGHDNLVLGLSFVRRMRDIGAIVGDVACNRVLDLTNEQYLMGLERLYSPYGAI